MYCLLHALSVIAFNLLLDFKSVLFSFDQVSSIQELFFYVFSRNFKIFLYTLIFKFGIL